MRKAFWLMGLVIGVMGAVGLLAGERVALAQCNSDEVETNIITGSRKDASGNAVKCVKKDKNAIYNILNLALEILMYGIGVLAVLGIVVAGIQYTTAGGSEEKMVKAKNKIYQVMVGLVVYAMMWALLKWLIPGFN